MKTIAYAALMIILLFSFDAVFAQQAFYDVVAGDGNGLRFWQSDTYKIHMGRGTEYQYGAVTDYSIKMNMNNDPARGWTWGVTGQIPVASINTSGNMKLAGTLTAMGNVELATGAKVAFSALTSTSPGEGITWYTPDPMSYGIFRTPGAWATPNYQQLRLQFSTGIILDPGSAYGKSYVDIQGGGLRVSSGNVYMGMNGGRIGIGTFTPYADSKLHIKSSGSNEWSLMSEAFANDKLIGFGHDGSNGIIAVSYVANGGWSPLQFHTQNLARMTITVDGNIGIGTISPDQKLTVNGIIHSKEVKVDMSIPGPDYVFEKDYNLLSLSELENYINQNKHLPEVPSAKEMEKDGLNLKEMNLILLKKVEELTLHMIDANNEINQLKKDNAEMKEEFSRFIKSHK
jgi:hypothetical protein